MSTVLNTSLPPLLIFPDYIENCRRKSAVTILVKVLFVFFACNRYLGGVQKQAAGAFGDFLYSAASALLLETDSASNSVS